MERHFTSNVNSMCIRIHMEGRKKSMNANRAKARMNRSIQAEGTFGVLGGIIDTFNCL